MGNEGGDDHDHDPDIAGMKSKVDSYVSQMQQRSLHLSAAQQSKFNEKKGMLSQYFPISMLFQSYLFVFAANVLNDDFAYL
jgi:hypothetical protein